MRQLKVRAELANSRLVRDFLQKSLRNLACSEEEAMRLQLALHEIFVNIAVHAYPRAKGEVVVEAWNEGKTVFLRIRDWGIPFDPGDAPLPDMKEKIKHGTKGGLGVHLIKNLTDGYSYKRQGKENILTIHMTLG